MSFDNRNIIRIAPPRISRSKRRRMLKPPLVKPPSSSPSFSSVPPFGVSSLGLTPQPVSVGVVPSDILAPSAEDVTGMKRKPSSDMDCRYNLRFWPRK